MNKNLIYPTILSILFAFFYFSEDKLVSDQAYRFNSFYENYSGEDLKVEINAANQQFIITEEDPLAERFLHLISESGIMTSSDVDDEFLTIKITTKKSKFSAEMDRQALENHSLQVLLTLLSDRESKFQ